MGEEESKSAVGRRRPFSNGINATHLLFLALIFVVRRGLLPVVTASSGEAHEGEIPEYEVFHVDFEYVQLPFIISLWIFVSSLAKIGFHMTPWLHNIFPESCLLIVVGIVIGFLLIITSDEVPTTLTPDTFFLYMLPPIIFDAGYFMPNRLFFDHLGTILLMAVVGTIFNMLTMGSALYACGVLGIFGVDPPSILETFLFASLIVAVDPVAVLAVFEEIHVDEILYIVVFGESLLNDAVTVVLYHMFEAYVDIGEGNIEVTDILKGFASFLVVALGGTFIGIIWGYLTGFVTRFTNHARVLEPLFVFVMAYMSYLNAEIFHMSGILAITFCGITMKNYVERNISSKSQTTLKYALKMLSGSSETIIFMFLGVATIHDEHEWNWNFVLCTIGFCTLFRIIGVILLAAIANNYRLHKLKVVDQFVMMYGGLRGAVAFALVLLIDEKKVPHAPMFVTTTIAVVYWTVFVQGITIKPLVKFLNVKTQSEKDPTMNERIAGRFMDHVVSGMEGILGELGNLRMRDMYKYFDTKYIKPCLLRENHYKDPKIIETFENLTNRDAVEFMKRNPTQFAGLKSMAEMSGMGLSSSSSTVNFLRANQSMLGASQANLENLDMKEMAYTPSQKDLTETKIHHMLSENLFMPRARPRRMSYSRHAMKEEDLAMNHDVNYRVHMHVRRMMSENKRRKRRNQLQQQRRAAEENPQSLKDGSALSPGSRHDANGDLRSSKVTFETDFPAQKSGMRVSGSAKQLRDERVHEAIREEMSGRDGGFGSDDDDGGIVLSVGGGSNSPSAPRSAGASGHHVNVLSVNVTPTSSPRTSRKSNKPGILVQSTSNTLDLPPPYSSSSATRHPMEQPRDPSPVSTPWLIRGGLSNPAYVRDLYDDGDVDSADGMGGDWGGETPSTEAEAALPWKRTNEEEQVCPAPVKQREFPAWLKNEDYMVHGTPTQDILREMGGVIDTESNPASRRESVQSHFEDTPGSAIRRTSIDYQERPPMSFGRRPSSNKGLRTQISRGSVTATIPEQEKEVENEEDETSRM